MVSPIMPGTASTMLGVPSTDLPSGGALPASGSVALSTTPTVAMPKLPEIEPANPVPIIQPTDLGTQTSPTAGRSYQ